MDKVTVSCFTCYLVICYELEFLVFFFLKTLSKWLLQNCIPILNAPKRPHQEGRTHIFGVPGKTREKGKGKNPE